MHRLVITGGHHSSALPVIDILKQEYPELEIYWFGHKYSMSKDRNVTLEYLDITRLKLPFYELHAGKFYRTFNIFRLMKIPFGLVQSFILLLKLKPDLILSFGGYLAVPVVFSGWILGIPSVTHEQTIVAGYANKIIAKFAKKILITWPASEKYFKKDKTVLTGIPLRKEIFETNSNSFICESSIPTLYITAGKTGSHILNETVSKNLKKLLANFNVIHQTGDHSYFKDYEKLLQQYEDFKDNILGKYHLRKFVHSDEIGEAFSKADIVISRSGAHTCYELLALNQPCILIPIPWVSHNEQFENASNLAKLGIACVLEEKELDKSDIFFKTIESFSKNLHKYELNKKDVLIINSAERIVHEIKKVYEGKDT